MGATQVNGAQESTIQLHGLLLYAYCHATGWKLLKAGYWPDRWGLHTWALWVLTGALLGMAFSPLCPVTWVAHWVPVMVYVLMPCVYYPLAEYSISQSLSSEFARSGIKGEATQQRWWLRRTVLHYLWFADDVRQKINPSRKEIERCLAFIESNRKDKPPSWTSFFRHPLVVLTIGLFFYAFHLQIAESMQHAKNFEEMNVILGEVFIVVLLLLALGWFFYSMFSNGPLDDWRFERCVRWYLIDQQEDQKE